MLLVRQGLEPLVLLVLLVFKVLLAFRARQGLLARLVLVLLVLLAFKVHKALLVFKVRQVLAQRV